MPHFPYTMKPSDQTRENLELSDLPIARIDAQDLSQVLPIREYLEGNGCAVVINRKASILETYHIICGNKEFVKECLEHVDHNSVFPFVVLFVSTKQNFFDDLSAIRAKIAVVSSSSLSAREVPKIFAFFFTGQGNIFKLENERASYPDSLVKEIEEVPLLADTYSETKEDKHHDSFTLHPIVEESLLGDSPRVSHIIADLFSKDEIQKNEHPEKPQEQKARHSGSSGFHQKSRKKRPLRFIIRSTLLFLCIFFAPMFWYIVSLSMIAGVQWYGYREIASGKTTHIATVTNVTSYWVGQARGTLSMLSLPLRLFRFESIVRSQERLLSIVTDVVASELSGITLISESREMAPLIFSRNEPSTNSVSPLVVVDRTRLALDDLTNRLGLADAEIRVLSSEDGFLFTLPASKRVISRLQEELTRSLAAARAIQQLVTLYRVTAGFDKKRTYLLALQNSNELRPTGGFIGSVALVTVADGLLNDFAVQDVYALDGQLKGHVDPPGPIKELLNQEHWYLRDSNWDPDFRASGERAAWFYEKETGNSVDGVVAVSTPFLTRLLEVTGPLDLPDYNDRITKDNFFGKSLYYTKADFFPGSTQKKDFLSSLTMAIIAKLASGGTTDIVGLSRAAGNALEAGDIQFWFPDALPQALAEQAGWAGRIDASLPCEPSCTVEKIRIVESNMSVNKVNAYITRDISARTDVSAEGEIDSTVEILYKNASADDAALSGGGVYRTYVRAYLPTDALVLSIAIDGKEISLKPVKEKGPVVLPYRDHDVVEGHVMSVGVAFDVPPSNGQRKITLTYRRGKPFVFDGNRGEFILQIRKQPGVTQTTLNASIGYPTSWRATPDREPATGNARVAGFLANVRELRYNEDLNRTETYSVQFIKAQ